MVILDLMLVGVPTDEVGEVMAESGVSWLRPAVSDRGGGGRSFRGDSRGSEGSELSEARPGTAGKAFE